MQQILAPGVLHAVLSTVNEEAKGNVTVLMMGHCDATQIQVSDDGNMCWECMRKHLFASMNNVRVRCMGFLGCESAAPVVTCVDGVLYSVSRLLHAMTVPGPHPLNVEAFVGYGQNTNNPAMFCTWLGTCHLDMTLMLTVVTSPGTPIANALLPDVTDKGSDYPFRFFAEPAATNGSPLLLFQHGATRSQAPSQPTKSKRKRAD
jgi:hypothetical protein